MQEYQNSVKHSFYVNCLSLHYLLKIVNSVIEPVLKILQSAASWYIGALWCSIIHMKYLYVELYLQQSVPFEVCYSDVSFLLIML